MEYNAFVLRATVDELLRRRYDDYEEFLRREINAQVDDCKSPSRMPRFIDSDQHTPR